MENLDTEKEQLAQIKKWVQENGLSVVMGVAVHGLHHFLEGRLGGGGFPGDLCRLAACVAAGTLLIIIGVRLLHIPEASHLLARITGRGGER